jgi:hypothetical protein
MRFTESPEHKAKRMERKRANTQNFKASWAELNFKGLAAAAGFTMSGDLIKPMTLGGTWVSVDGASARVLEGTGRDQGVGTTAVLIPFLGPLALVGAGQKIAVEITAADGTKIVGSTPKKKTVKAHKFCAALNNANKEE